MSTPQPRHSGQGDSGLDPVPAQADRRRGAGRRTATFPKRKQAEQALRFLSEASTLLAGSLDYETTLTQVARLAVPTLADWCTIHLVEDNQSIRWLALVHGDPEKAELARELQRRYPRDPHGSEGVANVVRTGRSALYAEISEAQLAARAHDAKHLQLLRAVASTSAMIVPLVAHGRTLGALSFLSTCADRRYGPADLQLAEELARRAALAIDNARLYEEAQAALRVRDQVLSAITHDLVQPLASIKASAELLSETLAAGDIAVAGWLAGRIDAAAGKMTAMIGELLDLARMQIGQPLELQRHSTDLVALARQQADAYQKTTEGHRIRVEAVVPELVGKWDVLRLERVIGNLLSNAVKYSPEGGEITVTLTLERDEGGAWAQLSVRDEGVGIPALDLPHVFEWFHRGSNVAGRIAGTGIGLAGARQIVEQHGGALTVTSQEGQGTTFTMRLPLR